MKRQIIITKINDIEPLENGKCEYLVDCHDFGNLEILVNRKLDYQSLNYYLTNPKNYIAENKYN